VPKQRCAPPGGLPVKCLVFPRYRADQPTTVRPLSPIQKLERLTHARSWLSLDRRRFGITLDWLKETPGYELNHASLEDGVRVIKRLLSRERLDPGLLLD
jgi:hypothetical protein